MDMEIDAALAYKIVQTGLKVLSARVLLVLAMLMVFGLTCAAMWAPTYERIGLVALFGVIVFWPICKMDRRLAPERALIVPQGESQ
jgi:hypothetical protein